MCKSMHEAYEVDDVVDCWGLWIRLLLSLKLKVELFNYQLQPVEFHLAQQKSEDNIFGNIEVLIISFW